MSETPQPPTEQELREFFSNSSQEITDYLQRAIPLLQELPVMLRSAQPQQGLQQVAQVTEGLSLMLEYLQAAQTLSFLAEHAGNFAMLERDLSAAIIQLADAMEQQDTGLMADIVEYELIERLEALNQQVSHILA